MSSGAKVSGRCDAHLDAGPAIVVVAGGDHGDAFDAELELGEIGHGRKRQADVVDLGAAGQQPGDQRSFDRGRIRAVVVADDDAHRHAALAHQRGKAEADRFEAEQVDLLREAPASIVFAKPGRLDERQALEFDGVGDEVLAGLWEHTFHSWRFRVS